MKDTQAILRLLTLFLITLSSITLPLSSQDTPKPPPASVGKAPDFKVDVKLIGDKKPPPARYAASPPPAPDTPGKAVEKKERDAPPSDSPSPQPKLPPQGGKTGGVKLMGGMKIVTKAPSKTSTSTPAPSKLATDAPIGQSVGTHSPNGSKTVEEESQADAGVSGSLFFFCTVLFFVAVALVVKLVQSGRRSARMRAGGLDFGMDGGNWRLSASRSSGQGMGRLGLGGGPAMRMPSVGGGGGGVAGLNLSGSGAVYTPVTTAPTAPSGGGRGFRETFESMVGVGGSGGGGRDDRLVWERQFFNDEGVDEELDDDEEALARSMDQPAGRGDVSQKLFLL